MLDNKILKKYIADCRKVDLKNNGVFLIDRHGTILNINAVFTELLGYSLLDLPKMRFADIAYDVSEIVKKGKSASWIGYELYYFCHCQKQPMEMKLWHKNGYYVSVRLHSYITWDDNGQIENAVGVFEELDLAPDEICPEAQDNMDDRMWELDENFLNIFERSGDGIMMADFNGRLTHVNPPLLEMFQYTLSEMIGRYVMEFVTLEGFGVSSAGEKLCFDESYSNRQIETVDRGIADGFIKFDLMHIRRKDNVVVPIEGTISVLHSRQGGARGAIAIFKDITERRKVAISNCRVKQELELEVKKRTIELEDVNTALRVLLKVRDDDREALEQTLNFSVRELCMPVLEKLQSFGMNRQQREYLEVLKSNLNNITSNYAKQIKGAHDKLTPAEIDVANLVKLGKSSKEIAEIANISPRTVDSHRESIRNKFEIKKKKVNLRSYLLSLQ